jgi:hypothetical protein
MLRFALPRWYAIRGAYAIARLSGRQLKCSTQYDARSGAALASIHRKQPDLVLSRAVWSEECQSLPSGENLLPPAWWRPKVSAVARRWRRPRVELGLVLVRIVVGAATVITAVGRRDSAPPAHAHKLPEMLEGKWLLRGGRCGS